MYNVPTVSIQAKYTGVCLTFNNVITIQQIIGNLSFWVNIICTHRLQKSNIQKTHTYNVPGYVCICIDPILCNTQCTYHIFFLIDT